MPDWKPEILRRLSPLKLAPARETEIAEEVAQHLEDRYRELLSAGQGEDAAYRTSLDELQGEDFLVGALKPVERDLYREPVALGTASKNSFVGILQDVRYALRMLRKSPAFTTVSILTLALGIGANTAIFSVVNAVLLRPLPFPHSERIVSIETFDDTQKLPQETTSYPDFFDWRAQNRVFSHAAAFHYGTYVLGGVEQPAHLSGQIVTSDFFSTLEAAPALGRGFLREEEQKGQRVVVLSDSLWRSQFSADSRIIGRSIILNNQNYAVVGVAPRGFDFPISTPPAQLWTTCADDADMLSERSADFLNVIGRLKSGVSLAQAQADMTHIDANLAKQYPEADLHYSSAMVEPELQYLVGDIEPALLVLFGAVGCVLLIACANVASLLLARSLARNKEMVIRAAMGARRIRVIRQLLTESILLALFGGAFGALLAFWGTRGLVRLVPQDIPRMSQIRMDGHVFLFTLLAAVITGILFGLAPALQSSKTNLVDSLREGGRGLSSGFGHNRLRSVLVVGEVALALALLMGAGLMIQSFARLRSVNPGFNPHNVLTFRFDLPDAQYNTSRQKVFYQQLLDRLNAIPGVQSAAAAVPLPLTGTNFTIDFTIEGRPVAKGDEPVEEVRMVSPGYFRTMGIPFVEGRDFAAADTPNSPNVVIVDDGFAKRYFPNEDPVGKQIQPGLSDSDVPNAPEPMRRIIGVVGNVKTHALSRGAKPEYYLPYQQGLISHLYMIVRTKAAPESVLGAARDAIRSMDPSLPFFGVRTMDQYVGASVAQPRLSASLLSIFAGLALALTALGLYGVLSYSVAQRTHEIGICMAMGAQKANVIAMVMRQAMLLAAIGWIAGMIAGLVLTRWLSSQLYGIRRGDPVTVLGITVVLAAVALVASYIPARRAVRVDPIVALRHE